MSSTGLYEDLGLYLAAGDARLTIGQTLFGYQLPDSTSSPDVSSTGPTVAIIPESGLGAVDRYRPAAGGQPAMERPGFTIVVRSTDGAGGVPSAQPTMAVAAAVHSLLQAFPPNSTVAGGTHGRIGCVEMLAPPYLADRDERGRYMMVARGIVWDATP